MDKEAIKQIIPYTDEFLLIDEVKELDKDSITALKTVTEADCKGHFKDYPIMPGALTVEGMGQAASLLIRKNIENHESKDILAYKVNNTIFKEPVFPGQQLIFKITLTNLEEKRAEVDCKAYVEDNIVAQALITLAIVDKEFFRQK